MNFDVQIVPTLNVKTEELFVEQLKQIEQHAPIIQIDCADGNFTSWKNWYDPETIATLMTPARFELHLMVENPLEELKKWYHVTNIARVILHVETIEGSLISAYHEALDFGNFDVGFAINPDTDRAVLEEIISNLGYIMFLGVSPGKSGQQFQKQVLQDLKKFATKHDHLILEVDGGVTRNNIKEIYQAGANIICSGSGIFNEITTPENNLNILYQAINQ